MKKIDLIYIVEDDPIAVILAKRRIELHPQFGNCQVFANGEEAINYLQRVIAEADKLPNLILLDLNMPVMDGWQFLEKYVHQYPEIMAPVYILTSSIHPQDIARAKSYPLVKGFISKPLTQEVMDNIFAELTNQ
jgi:CheY-like chemotaxis protein